MNRRIGAEEVSELITAYEKEARQLDGPRLLASPEAMQGGAEEFTHPERANVRRMLFALDRAASGFREEIDEGGRKQQVLYQIFKAWLRSTSVDVNGYTVLVQHIARRLGI